jgi:hypothetical protein
MTHDVIRHKPEDDELYQKQTELSELQSRLADREFFLTALRSELIAFEQTYLTILGTRYAKLDELSAEIAECVARAHPEDRRAQETAGKARSQANESRSAADIPQKTKAGTSATVQSPTVKSLYREVARKIHPDLATDSADRLRREQLMREANTAYEQGDEARLRAILEEYESSPESIKGEGTAAELVRVIRKIAQVKRRLVEIDEEVRQLEKSERFQMKSRVEEAAAEGRDLLQEMAEDLDSQIAGSRERLKNLSER